MIAGTSPAPARSTADLDAAGPTRQRDLSALCTRNRCVGRGSIVGMQTAALQTLRAGTRRGGWDRAGEPALVRAAQRGSAEAFAELFRRHWPRAHRAAWLVVRDATAAEDVAQEAFLSAVRSLDRFDRRRPFGPWLHRIVVNRAIDYARARELRREVSGEAFEPASADTRDAPSEDVLAALAALPPEQRAVIVMRHLLGFTPGEIARALGLPRGTVNSRLRRGLDGLQGSVER
jgi:RNA polymerase sigma-70 factor, ECF subfamily